MTTEEQNLLIAEFMNLSIHSRIDEYKVYYWVDTDLITVYENLNKKKTVVWFSVLEYNTFDTEEKYKNHIYDAVVKFIQWYN